MTRDECLYHVYGQTSRFDGKTFGELFPRENEIIVIDEIYRLFNELCIEGKIIVVNVDGDGNFRYRTSVRPKIVKAVTWVPIN